MTRISVWIVGVSLALSAVLFAQTTTSPAGAPGTTASAPARVPATTQPGDGLTEAVHRSALAWLDAFEASGKLDELPPIAEKIADRLIAGGTLYVGGDPGFCDEMIFRIGGLAGATMWANGPKLTDKDVLIIGQLDAAGKGARYLPPAWIGQNRGNMTSALTVHIGSHRWPQPAKLAKIADKSHWPGGLFFLDTDAPGGASLTDVSTGQVATCVMALCLEGEIDAAITRKGKTPAVLTAMEDPAGAEFDNKIKGKNVLDEPKLQPIPAGQLSREFIRQCRSTVGQFLLADQAKVVRSAAARLAECQRRGGTIFAVADGHIHPRGETLPPALTRLMMYGPVWQWESPEGLAKGDVLLYIGYIDYPQKELDAAVKAGAEGVVISVKPGKADPAVTTILSSWTREAVVDLPGYPYRALGVSGVVQAVEWYSLMAEAEKIANCQLPIAD